MTRIASLCLLFSLLGCDRAAPTAPPAPGATAPGDFAPVLRAYDVPGDYAEELDSVVNRLLYKGKDLPPAGRAVIGPAGQLIVTAPVGVHAGIAELLAQLEKAPKSAAPTVEVTYWVVKGSPAGAENEPIPAALEQIAPALKAITEADGPQRYERVEKLQVTTLSGQDGRVSGQFVEVQQMASARGGQVIANTRIVHTQGGQMISTQVSVPVDELLVMGQAAANKPTPEAPAANLYYVMRAHVTPAR